MSDPARRPGSLCFVVADPNHLDPGDETGALIDKQTRALALHDWQVLVLYTGPTTDVPASRRVRQRLEGSGRTFLCLEDLRVPLPLCVPSWPSSYALHRADRVRHALEELHPRHAFNLVVFADSEGGGFRAIQARRAGLAFLDLGIAVLLTGTRQTTDLDPFPWADKVEAWMTEFGEQYAFEHADFQLAVSASLLNRTRRLGWRVQRDAQAADPHSPSATLDLYGGLLARVRRARAAAPALPNGPHRCPLVTVAVTHFNLGLYLPETLASLAAQTYANLEVLVIDDGSTNSSCQRVFDEQERAHAHFRFFRQANHGVSAARNRLLAEARGEFFCPFDGDDLAQPDMVERMVAAMRRQPAAGLSTYQLGFKERADLDRQAYAMLYRPPGGPRVLTGLGVNVYGGTMAIFRSEALREIGGYDIDPANMEEDWHLYVKLANAGLATDVIPTPLAYYRMRPDSRNRTADLKRSRLYVIRELARSGNLTQGELARLLTTLATRHQEPPPPPIPPPVPLRHRLVDELNALVKRVPGVHGWLKALLSPGVRTCRRERRPAA